jgi:hypothetical protein
LAITADGVFAFDAAESSLLMLDSATGAMKRKWAVISPSPNGKLMYGMAYDGTGFWLAENATHTLRQYVLP